MRVGLGAVEKFYCDGLGFEYMLEFPGFFPEQKIAMLRLPNGGVIEMFSHGKPFDLPSADDRTFTRGKLFPILLPGSPLRRMGLPTTYVIHEAWRHKPRSPADYDMNTTEPSWPTPALSAAGRGNFGIYQASRRVSDCAPANKREGELQMRGLILIEQGQGGAG